MEEIPERVAAYRADFRREQIKPGYSGWAHLAVVTGLVCIGLGGLFGALDHVSAWEMLALPVGFCFANAVEYAVHRWVMHVIRPGLAAMYRRHTGQHHRFFGFDAMTTDSPQDFAIILFPPFVVVFFLGLIATPAGLLLGWLLSPDAGLLFGVVALSYFLFYEWMHLASHLPPDSLLGRMPGVAFVRAHHRIHHDTRRMRECNFNITVPLTDLVLGTLRRD